MGVKQRLINYCTIVFSLLLLLKVLPVTGHLSHKMTNNTENDFTSEPGLGILNVGRQNKL